MRRPLSVVALAAVAIAGCGEERSARDRLARAPEATAAEGSAGFSAEMRMRLGDRTSGMDFTASGEGAYDLEGEAGRFEIRIPGTGGPTEVLYDRDAIYFRVPSALGGRQGRWIRKARGDAAREGPGVWTTGPTEVRRILDAVAGEITQLGTDTVRGSEVEGFGFTVSGAELGPQQGAEAGAIGDLEIPAEAWLDGGDRVRRLVVKLDLGPLLQAARNQVADSLAAGREQALGAMMASLADTMTVSVELFDFGTDVEVRLPEDADVVDAEALSRQQTGRGRGGGARRAAGDSGATGG